MANMIALGALAAISGLISAGALKHTIKKYVPPKVLDVDRKAVDRGVELARKSGFLWGLV